MRNRLSLSTLPRRFARCERGIAAVEFALIAPLLALFLVGTTVATQSLWVNGKIAQTGSVLGDLVAQEVLLTDGSFNTLMSAAPVLIEPFPLEDLTIEVTASIACHQDPENIEESTPRFFVVWNNTWTSGSITGGSQSPGDPLRTPPTDLSIRDGDQIVRTRVTYTYRPAISQTAGHVVDMDETAYHQPRDKDPVSYPSREGHENTRDCDVLLNR